MGRQALSSDPRQSEAELSPECPSEPISCVPVPSYLIAVCQSQRTSLLCASPSVPHCCVPFIPLEQLCVLTASGGSLTWKCSTPSALASPQTIAGLFRGPGDATMLMLRSLPCN